MALTKEEIIINKQIDELRERIKVIRKYFLKYFLVFFEN
jgi:hypothetical protein